MKRHHESRELVLVGGPPGSGATWLAQEIVRQERQVHKSAEYVSIGETIRRIGRGALASLYADEVLAHLQSKDSHELLPPDVISGILHEAAYYHDGAHTLVIEGFPQAHSQLPELEELISNSNRDPIGMLNTVVPEYTAYRRLGLRTNERELTLDQQRAHLRQHAETSPGVRRALLERGIMIRDIDTDGDENEHNNDRMVSINMAKVALNELRTLRSELHQIDQMEQRLAA